MEPLFHSRGPLAGRVVPRSRGLLGFCGTAAGVGARRALGGPTISRFARLLWDRDGGGGAPGWLARDEFDACGELFERRRERLHSDAGPRRHAQLAIVEYEWFRDVLGEVALRF